MKKFSFSILFFSILIHSNTIAQSGKDLLTGNVSQKELDSILIPFSEWQPYPKIDEREFWENLPEKVKTDYINKAEKYTGKEWEILPASVFLDFARNGNRSRYEGIYFARRQRLITLVLAELIENKGRFIDDIANGIWATCEETFWGLPAHMGMQEKGVGLPDVKDPIIDLFAAETGAMLAYTYYLMNKELDKISPLINERIIYEENRRIIDPYMEKHFWWMSADSTRGINNWNPWINSNVLAVLLFTENNNLLRNKAVYKTMKSVDNFINSYPEDGGCDEGPGYWSRAAGAMFDFLELLHSATDGKISIYNVPKIQNMAKFIYKTWIGGNYYVNFADASAKNEPDAGLVYRFGKRINDPLMEGFGSLLAKQQDLGEHALIPSWGSLNTVLPDLASINEITNSKSIEPFVRDIWMPGREIMIARSVKNSSRSFYIAAKGGSNNESHNHNDVGNFIVYCNDKPVLIDVGVETYTAKTFGPNRYDIWTMQSQYHNLPTINGIQEKAGKDFYAEDVKYKSDDNHVMFSLSLAKSYPEEAEIIKWERTIELVRGKKVILNESYKLKECSVPLKLNLMTKLSADVSVPGEVLLSDNSGKYKILYDKNKFKASLEERNITDPRLLSSWGSKISRIVLTAKEKKTADNYKVEISEDKE